MGFIVRGAEQSQSGDTEKEKSNENRRSVGLLEGNHESLNLKLKNSESQAWILRSSVCYNVMTTLPPVLNIIHIVGLIG